MHKRLLPLFFLAPALGLPAWGAPPPTVIVDGNRLNFDQPPVEQGGRLLVPLRGIFEGLGATVVYNAATRGILATRGQTTVQLTLGSRDASVNGRLATLDVPADTVGGRTLVPLRFVSEALGASVKWEGATRTVLITASAPVMPPPPPPIPGPQIGGVVLEAQEHLSPGDIARVRAQGEPGGRAWFEIRGQVPHVDMQERRSGEYYGEWTAPKGVFFHEAEVVVHLDARGQEAVAEAPQRLSVGRPQNTPGVIVGPADESVVASPRPTIRVDFPTDIRLDSIRLILDRHDDCSGEALRNGRHLEWTPPFDLSPGKHRALVTASDREGRELRRSWDFTVGASQVQLIQNVNLSSTGPLGPGETLQVLAQGQPGLAATFDIGGRQGIPMAEGPAGTYRANYTVRGEDSGAFPVLVHLRARDGRIETKQSAQPVTLGGRAPSLSISNPRSGAMVPANFNVQGDTVPGAPVHLNIEVHSPQVPGVADAVLFSWALDTRADGRGHFDQLIQAGAAQPGSRVFITVTARGGSNQFTFPRIQVTRI